MDYNHGYVNTMSIKYVLNVLGVLLNMPKTSIYILYIKLWSINFFLLRQIQFINNIITNKEV